MSFASKVKVGAVQADPVSPGFVLPAPDVVHYPANAVDEFRRALTEQEAAVEYVDGSALGEFDLTGQTENGLVVSQAAFSDLCHVCNVPSSFVRRVAQFDEDVARTLVGSVIRNVWQAEFASSRRLVVDRRNNRIEGIVGVDSYSPLSNARAVNYIMSSMPGLEISGGWIVGPSIRVTALTPRRVEVRKGDIVRIGTDAQNSIAGDRSFLSSLYMERLVCINGLTSRSDESVVRVVHRGDVHDAVQGSLVRSVHRAERLIEWSSVAANQFVSPDEIVSIRRFIAESSNGGGAKVDLAVTRLAQDEAMSEGRAPEELTLWNWVNGLTAHARSISAPNRRVVVEDLAYRTLARFVAELN